MNSSAQETELAEFKARGQQSVQGNSLKFRIYKKFKKKIYKNLNMKKEKRESIYWKVYIQL